MGTVRDILNQQQRHALQSIHPSETVLAATQKMNKFSIGALLVIDNEENLVGIFTERDVLNRVVAAQLDSCSTLVGEVMTQPVAVCGLNASHASFRAVM